MNPVWRRMKIRLAQYGKTNIKGNKANLSGSPYSVCLKKYLIKLFMLRQEFLWFLLREHQQETVQLQLQPLRQPRQLSSLLLS